MLTDGQKAISLTGTEGWNYFTNAPKTTQEEQYAMVAAAFRAYNLKANTVSSIPFVLYKGKEVYDISSKWENKVGFMPNPSELLRLDTLSLIATNSAYNLRTTDALGYKTRGMYHAVAYSFSCFTDPITGVLDYIERHIGTQIERYTPDDKRLVRIWKLDHTTEVLPSRNTEAQAIMSAAGQVYYADMWISHFYARGGIPPTLIAMKGMMSPEKKAEEEMTWTEWLRQLGPKFTNRIARIFNADAMDVKQLGSSITDLKNNEIYKQALENISLGIGIPISRLLSNSANYATAQQDDAGWYRDDIIPFCNFLAYEYNRQVFEPMGLRMEFTPEVLDPEQEDETQRAQAFSTYGDTFTKYPTYGLWRGMALTLGLEISDELDKAAQEYYADKEKQAEQVQEQTQPNAQTPVETPQEDAEDTAPEDTEEDDTEDMPAKWIPTIEQLSEIKTWQTFALRKFKKGQPLDFPFEVRTLPADFADSVKVALLSATAEEAIKAAFTLSGYVAENKTDPISDIKALAESINLLARTKEAVKA